MVVNILANSFDANRSVNYIIKQDSTREERLLELMGYSFEVCQSFGQVLLSDDKKACALILFPDKRKMTLRSILMDANLAFRSIGLSNVRNSMARGAAIKKLHPDTPFYYLWFIGVDPSAQDKGLGTSLLNEIIQEAAANKLPVYLEASTVKNIPWYEKLGFTVYKKLDFGYDLSCMKKE